MIEKDDLDDMIMAEPSERERVKMEHEFLNKAASHPVRRQLVKKIGAFGATKDEIQEDVELDDKSFKYHTEFLMNGDLLNLVNGKYFLTEKGLEMLSIIG
ncbi:hypothetical protein V7O62_01180 [Methanolobus sp. ZRKC2]|uniref:hypothetical protein n=1 Tax=Methanolobus sp. ZRKC2 TaxID=3125783 RepID=UPI00325527CC